MNSTLLAALISSGATTAALPSAWREAIIASGATDGQLSTYLKAQGLSGSTAEMFWNYLGSKGYVGTLSDRLSAASRANDLFISYATWSSTNKDPQIVVSANGRVITMDYDYWRTGFCDTGKSSGKWLWENKLSVGCSAQERFIGIGTTDTFPYTTTYLRSPGGFGYYQAGYLTSGGLASYGGAFAEGDIITVLLNMDDKILNFKVNGTLCGAIDISSVTTAYPGYTCYGHGPQWETNFGQDTFLHPETGYSGLSV